MDITMSTFKEYLSESVKTYEFKIKIAGDLPEGFDKAMKTALMKYDCASVSKGKRIPIQEAPLDFPSLKNMNVTIFDIECRYPTTPQTLTEYLADQLKLSHANIRVRNTREQENIDDGVNDIVATLVVINNDNDDTIVIVDDDTVTIDDDDDDDSDSYTKLLTVLILLLRIYYHHHRCLA